MPILAIIAAVIEGIKIASEVAPIAIEAINNARPAVMDLVKALKGEDLTDADRAEIDAQLSALSAKLQEPLPE